MKYRISILILMIASFTGICQDHADTSRVAISKVKVYQDSRLEKLENKRAEVKKVIFSSNTTSSSRNPKSAQGYRIQLYSGNNRTEANRLRAQFVHSYPGTNVYVQFIAPYIKIRVGDYQTKAEANAQLKYFNRVYPSAFIVSSTVNVQ